MGERDASTKGQSIREGNSGGRPSKYKPEYAETASKLCARLGFTDEQLADWFEIGIRTLHEWKLKHPDFAEALKVGKAETDDLVERATVAHIQGYYVLVDEMDRFGNVKKLRKWIPGNAHAGIKWLNCRRPEVYREQKEKKHILSMDDAFLRFLDQMDEKAKRERELNAPRGQQLIDDKQIVEAEIVAPAVAVAKGEQLVRTVLVQKQASPCLFGEMSINEKPKRVSRDYDSRCGFTDRQLRPNCGSSVWSFDCG